MQGSLHLAQGSLHYDAWMANRASRRAAKNGKLHTWIGLDGKPIGREAARVVEADLEWNVGDMPEQSTPAVDNPVTSSQLASVSPGSSEALRLVAAHEIEIAHRWWVEVTAARSDGHTWTEIAGWLGVTRQALQSRFATAEIKYNGS